MSLCPENDDHGGHGSGCEFNQNLSLFREIPLFAGMPIQVHKVLAYLCSRESFEPDELLFQQGDDDGQAIYLLSGIARLMRTDDQGREVPMAEYGVGDFIGGLSLLGPMPRLFSLNARTRVECMVLSRDKFQHAMEQFPEVMPKVLQAVIYRIREWDRHLLKNPELPPESIKEQVGVSII